MRRLRARSHVFTPLSLSLSFSLPPPLPLSHAFLRFSLFARTHAFTYARNACYFLGERPSRVALCDHARKKSLVNLPVAARALFRAIHPSDEGLSVHDENRIIYWLFFPVANKFLSARRVFQFVQDFREHSVQSNNSCKRCENSR